MALHSNLHELATLSSVNAPGPALESIPDRLAYGGLLLTYAGLIALLSLLAGIAVVSLGAVLPASMPATLLLWALALGAVSAAPPFARWLLRRLLVRPG